MILFLYKKIVITIFIIFGFNTSLLHAQCCPYVSDLTIFPINPTQEDSIYLLTFVSTPNIGNYLNTKIQYQDTAINITSRYSWGNSAMPSTFFRTINLGKLKKGNHHIIFKGESSNGLRAQVKDINIYIDDKTTQKNKINDIAFLDYMNRIKEGIVFEFVENRRHLKITSSDHLERISLKDSKNNIYLEYNKVESNNFTIDVNKLDSGLYYVIAKNELYKKFFYKL